MNKLLSLAVIASAVIVSTVAVAEDKTTTSAAPVATTLAAASSTAKTADAAKPVTGELKDGTKIEFGADGTVTILNSDGTKTAAPDGVLTMKDSTTFNVKDGKKVVTQ